MIQKDDNQKLSVQVTRYIKYSKYQVLSTEPLVREPNQDRIKSRVGFQPVQVMKESPEKVPQIKPKAPLVRDGDIEPKWSHAM